MKKVILTVLAVPFILAPAVILAQSGMKPSAATYISDEEVKAVNALPAEESFPPRIELVSVAGSLGLLGAIYKYVIH